MTYRERRQARAERLRLWADGRDAKSAASFARVHSIADNIPFGQPILVGHHSERRARRDQDRIHDGMRAGIDHADKAASMRARADNIEHAADHAIYSDDPDAIERLRERIAELEATRTRITAYNKAVRKAGHVTAEALALLDDKQRADLETLARVAPYQLRGGAFPAYATSNLGGQISKARDRLAAIERAREIHAEAAENAAADAYDAERAPDLYAPDPDDRCRSCRRPEADHDRRYDLAGSPAYCLA